MESTKLNSNYLFNDFKKSHKYAEDIYAAEKILDQKYKKVNFFLFNFVFHLLIMFFILIFRVKDFF